MRKFFNVVVEDDLSLAVLEKIIFEANRQYLISQVYGKRGCNYIDQKIAGFNNAAKGVPFIVLRDLDSWECPPILINHIFPYHIHPNLLLRIAVKELETWLLADKKGISKYLGIRRNEIPFDVEKIDKPKEFLIKLARKSRNRIIREDLVPNAGSTAKQGRGYNSRLSIFVRDRWNVKKAVENSDSLRRTYYAINNFKTSS